MFVNDPSELALPPKSLEDSVNDEPPRDYHEYFYDDLPVQGSRYAQPGTGFHTEVCRFDEQGNHSQMARNCPHFDASDEMGPRIKEGWTIQQNVS